jgi:chemotaxis protein CheD
MQHIVGIGEWKASSQAGDQIVTHALGSCLGITVYDPAAGVGGMVHVMLPQPGKGEEDDAAQRPGKYVGPGLEALMEACLKLGARRERLVLTAAGGATAREDGEDFFQIGRRNMAMLRKVLWSSGMLLKAHDTGGTRPRMLTLDIANGGVTVRSDRQSRRMI